MLTFGRDNFSGVDKKFVVNSRPKDLELVPEKRFGSERNIDKIMKKINSRQTINSLEIREKPKQNIFSNKLMPNSTQKNLALDDGIFDIPQPESENSKGLDRRLTSKFCIPYENSQASNNTNTHTTYLKPGEFSNAQKKLLGHVKQLSITNDYFSRRSRGTSNPISLSKQMTFGGAENSKNAVLKSGIEELSTFRSSKFFGLKK